MGNVSSITDAENTTTIYQYDDLNRLDCIEQPGVTVTEYDYDAQGNLIEVIDPEGLITRYSYDDMGRLINTESPDTGLIMYVYDEAGNMVRKDANGLVTDYTYDDINRRTGISHNDGSPGVTYTYDSGSGQYLKGRLASVNDYAGERHYSYDANGYLDTEQRIIQGVTYLTDYDFDAAGNLRTIIYPTGQTIEYQPDATDVALVAAVNLDPTGANQTLAQSISYQPFGPAAGMTLGNGVQTTQSFDLSYQVKTITSGSVLDLSFIADKNGNITTITNNLDTARSQSFTYDSLQRLTNASGIYGNIDFTYDKTGNRKTRTVDSVTDTYTYLAGTNQLDGITGSATINFDHDISGNLIVRTFVTGPAPGPASTPDYTYTHDGQRLAKSIDGQTTVYHYDIHGRLIAETDGSGNLVKGYIWLHGQPFAQFDASGSVYYYHNDHLGTPQRITNGSGAVVWAADYLPFGEADVTIETVRNGLRFAGQYYDQETGLHYNYHRYYDPSLGRYLRADPIGIEGGINLYTYVTNNPINDFDPFGLHGWALLGNKSTVVRPSVARTIPRITRGMARNNPKQTPKLNPKQVFRPAPELIKPQPKPWHYLLLRLWKPIAEFGVDDVLMMPPVGLPDGDSADHSNSISNQCKDSKNEKKVLVGSDAWNECTAAGQCM